MKQISFAVAVFTLLFVFGSSAHSHGRHKYGVIGHRGPSAKAQEQRDCCKRPPRVRKLKTIELSRRGFTKTEKHCCGIVMKGNYVRVIYKTYYSDGSEVLWSKEYRS